MDWFQIEKLVHQGCILSPSLLNFYAEYNTWNQGWIKHKLESRLPGEIAITSDMQMTSTLMGESEEEVKSLLMTVKMESEKADLKLNIQKMKIMASSLITSWQINGETMETVRDFIFLGSKITLDSDCGHEIKRCSLIGRKVMTNLHSVLKSRKITLPTKSI